jgi:hypothetical protein
VRRAAEESRKTTTREQKTKATQRIKRNKEE